MPVYEEVAAPAASNGHGTVDPVAVSMAAIQVEVNDYLRRLKDLNASPPVEVFQTLSAISARVAEIRNRLVRTDNRRFTALRTKEIDPLIEEVDRQFKFHSRIQAVRDSEMRLSGVVT